MRSRGNALTLTCSERARVIPSPCEVCAGFDPDVTPQEHQVPFAHSFNAIWDTGATASVITQAVVDACGLQPTGITQVNHAGGVEMQETYLINLRLQNMAAFHSIVATKAPLTMTQVLIGMDIISLGDFAITNKGGITIFTFRVPSSARTDYVKEEARFSGPSQHPGASFQKNKKGRR